MLASMSTPAKAPTELAVETTFGRLLRLWRNRRGMSQLDLALNSDVSQRHVSFLESGRAKPSRDMVLQLAGALDIPLRQQNELLLAAGFAPAFRARALGTPEMGEVNTALDLMLEQQEPYPAVVIDRYWTMQRGNRAAIRFMTFLAGSPPPAGAPPLNLMHALLAPGGLRHLVTNWAEVTRALLRTVHADVLAEGLHGEGARFLESLMAYPDVPAAWRQPQLDDKQMPLLPVKILKDGVALSFFTTIATLGTPRDVTLQEIRIETFYPADAGTAAVMRRWAAAETERVA